MASSPVLILGLFPYPLNDRCRSSDFLQLSMVLISWSWRVFAPWEWSPEWSHQAMGMTPSQLGPKDVSPTMMAGCVSECLTSKLEVVYCSEWPKSLGLGKSKKIWHHIPEWFLLQHLLEAFCWDRSHPLKILESPATPLGTRMVQFPKVNQTYTLW